MSYEPGTKRQQRVPPKRRAYHPAVVYEMAFFDVFSFNGWMKKTGKMTNKCCWQVKSFNIPIRELE